MPLTLKQKAAEMREAINDVELALLGFGDLCDLPDRWGEPRHRSELGVRLPVNCGQVYRLNDARKRLTEILNSEDYRL